MVLWTLAGVFRSNLSCRCTGIPCKRNFSSTHINRCRCRSHSLELGVIVGDCPKDTTILDRFWDLGCCHCWSCTVLQENTKKLPSTIWKMWSRNIWLMNYCSHCSLTYCTTTGNQSTVYSLENDGTVQTLNLGPHKFIRFIYYILYIIYLYMNHIISHKWLA